MKMPRLIAIVALIYCGQTILAMDMEIDRLPAYDIVTSHTPASLFADFPKPTEPLSAEGIIKNKEKIKQRYLTIKEKLEKFGCTLPFDADRETALEKKLSKALWDLDRYYGQFIGEIKKNGADASFLEQARFLNINDDNVARRLKTADITSKWQLVETINSAVSRNALLTLPLQGILQSYKREAPLRAQWIQDALNKLNRVQDKLKREQDELKRKQDELDQKAMDSIKEKIVDTQEDIKRYNRLLEKNTQILSTSTDPQALEDAQYSIDHYSEHLQGATQELKKLEDELKRYLKNQG
jgi:hypothetical protein